MVDFVGLLILILLIVSTGFLLSRAWRLKNKILKWVTVWITGLLTLVSTILLVLGLSSFYKLNQRYDNPVSSIEVAGVPEQIARGKQLAQLCTNCHTNDNQLPLSGANMVSKFGLPNLGTLYAPNLTPAGNIQDWSDGELIRAIREGINKDGRSLLIMPSDVFRHMSDEDVQALVAYLRSQPPAGAPTPKKQFNLFGALFMNLDDFRTAQPPAGQARGAVS